MSRRVIPGRFWEISMSVSYWSSLFFRPSGAIALWVRTRTWTTFSRRSQAGWCCGLLNICSHDPIHIHSPIWLSPPPPLAWNSTPIPETQGRHALPTLCWESSCYCCLICQLKSSSLICKALASIFWFRLQIWKDKGIGVCEASLSYRTRALMGLSDNNWKRRRCPPSPYAGRSEVGI